MATRTIALNASARVLRRRTFMEWILAVDAGIRQRSALKGLDRHLMRDIGVTGEERREELARPIWDAAQHWRK